MSFWRDLQTQGEIEDNSHQPYSRGPAQQVVVKNVQAAVDSAYHDLQNEHAEDAAEAEEEVRTLSEVERRLRKSNCYRAILDQPLFDDNASDEALEVEAEFRDFALTRLRELMGITSAKQAAVEVFSQDEQIALKTWAAKLMGKPAIFSVDSSPASATPTKPVSTPTVRSQAPVLPAPVEPRLRTMSDPDTRRGPGRPKGAKNKPKQETTQVSTSPTTPPTQATAQKQVAIVEGIKFDGTRGEIAVDMTKPVQPQGPIQRAPMPDQDMALSLEQTRAARNAGGNVVLQTLLQHGK